MGLVTGNLNHPSLHNYLISVGFYLHLKVEHRQPQNQKPLTNYRIYLWHHSGLLYQNLAGVYFLPLLF